MRSKFLFAAVATIAVTTGASAQSPVEQSDNDVRTNHKFIYMSRDEVPDSSFERELIDVFYYDQFRHSQDPRAPYFMFMSKNSKMAMGIGGKIEGTTWYDWNGSMNDDGVVPYDITIPSDPTTRNKFGASIANSALFFSVFGKSEKLGNYQFYIEAKFKGSHQFVLSKAYATVGDWTLGYAKSTFTDPSAQPTTVDFQGPNAEVNDKAMLVRYMHKFKNNFVVAASVEGPKSQIPSIAGSTQACSDYMPDFSAFVQYGSGSQHLRLSGIVRGLRYRSIDESRNYSVVGWGTHLSTVFRPIAPVTVYGAFVVGKGITSYSNDLQNDDLDLIADPHNPGRMYAPLSYGWYAAVQYNFTPKLFTTMIFSQQRFAPEDQPTIGNDTYKYGLYATANLIYSPTPRISFGAEYNMAMRKNYNNEHSTVDRVSVQAVFSF